MNEKELLYVKTIAEERNITRAAEKLHIAQPSLTQCVQRIEKSLECSLFHRTNTGMVLTDSGELYYQMACRVLDLWDHFTQELSTRNASGGHLTIGASWYNTILILSRILPEYSRLHPRVEVQLVEKNTQELARLLADGELDAILIHQYPHEYPEQKLIESKKVICVPVLKEQFCLVSHKSFKLHGDPPDKEQEGREETFARINLKNIEGLPFIRFSRTQRIRHISDFALDRAGVHVSTVVSVYGFPSALDCVSAGMGITFLPEFYVKKIQNEHQELAYYRIDNSCAAYWTASVCYYQSDYQPSALLSFLNLLIQMEPFMRSS